MSTRSRAAAAAAGVVSLGTTRRSASSCLRRGRKWRCVPSAMASTTSPWESEGGAWGSCDERAVRLLTCNADYRWGSWWQDWG